MLKLFCKHNSVTALLHSAEKFFIKNKLFFGHGSISAWDEAVFIASYVLNVNLYKAELKETTLTFKQKKLFLKIVYLRVKTKQPLSYIIKQAWFAGKKYYVDRRVIIPRSPFGELILAQFKPWLEFSPKSILDLCTGSGCLAIACYHAFSAGGKTNLKIDASDISADALSVAAKNLRYHNLINRINLIESDLFSAIPAYKYDLIISNPPYVDLTTFKKLPIEFHFEPKLALLSGNKGLDIVIKILRCAEQFLTDKGILIVEVGYLWKNLAKLYPKVNFMWLKLHQGGEGIFLLTRQQLASFKSY